MADRRHLRGASVRTRTTVGATLVVGVALLAGGAFMTAYLQRTLDQGRRDAAVARAQDVAALVVAGRLPTVLGSPNDDTAALQVVDTTGRVVAATQNLEGEAPMAPPPARSAPTAQIGRVPGLDDSATFRIVSVPAISPTGAMTVFAATSMRPAATAVNALRGILLAASPIALALVAATTWIVTGRALRPVEQIRAEVAEISAGQLHRRVSEPLRRDEVGRLAETMNSMLSRIQKAVDQQRRFVADASHELRTPLASVHVHLEQAITAPPSTDWPALLEGVLREHVRVERVVDDLLFLARLDAAPAEARREVDVDELIRAELAWRAKTDRAPVDYQSHPGPIVMGNASQLTRVVRNLLDNAERYRNESIALTLDSGSDRVDLRVIDDGPGIAAPDRERVFERFTRLDEARVHEGPDAGTGLGLAIARDIATAHGGSVTIEDRSAGTSVLVRLPVVRPGGEPVGDLDAGLTSDGPPNQSSGPV